MSRYEKGPFSMSTQKWPPGHIGRVGSGEDTDCICFKCGQIKLKIHCAEVKDNPGLSKRWMCIGCLKKREQKAEDFLFRSRTIIEGPSGHKRPS